MVKMFCIWPKALQPSTVPPLSPPFHGGYVPDKRSEKHGPRADCCKLFTRMAMRLGDSNMCCLLIGVGNIDPVSALTRGHDGQMVLRDESSENQENRPAIYS